MNDRAVSLFDNYEIEVNRTWKGRGAILCESDKGLLILKEYNGPMNKIRFSSCGIDIEDEGWGTYRL